MNPIHLQWTLQGLSDFDVQIHCPFEICYIEIPLHLGQEDEQGMKGYFVNFHSLMLIYQHLLYIKCHTYIHNHLSHKIMVIYKVVPVMKHYTIRHIRGVEVQIHAFLTLALLELSGQPHAPVTLICGESLIPTKHEVGWPSELVWL
jgi:hypothetical protein